MVDELLKSPELAFGLSWACISEQLHCNLVLEPVVASALGVRTILLPGRGSAS